MPSKAFEMYIVTYMYIVVDSQNTYMCGDYNLYETSRKVLMGTGSRTQGLLFKVRALYQLSYPSPIQFCCVNSGVVSNYPSVIMGVTMTHFRRLSRAPIYSWI